MSGEIVVAAQSFEEWNCTAGQSPPLSGTLRLQNPNPEQTDVVSNKSTRLPVVWLASQCSAPELTVEIHGEAARYGLQIILTDNTHIKFIRFERDHYNVNVTIIVQRNSTISEGILIGRAKQLTNLTITIADHSSLGGYSSNQAVLFYTVSDSTTTKYLDDIFITVRNQSSLIASQFALAFHGYRQYGDTTSPKYLPWYYRNVHISILDGSYVEGGVGTPDVIYDRAAFLVAKCCWRTSLSPLYFTIRNSFLNATKRKGDSSQQGFLFNGGDDGKTVPSRFEVSSSQIVGMFSALQLWNFFIPNLMLVDSIIEPKIEISACRFSPDDSSPSRTTTISSLPSAVLTIQKTTFLSLVQDSSSSFEKNTQLQIRDSVMSKGLVLLGASMVDMSIVVVNSQIGWIDDQSTSSSSTTSELGQLRLENNDMERVTITVFDSLLLGGLSVVSPIKQNYLTVIGTRTLFGTAGINSSSSSSGGFNNGIPFKIGMSISTPLGDDLERERFLHRQKQRVTQIPLTFGSGNATEIFPARPPLSSSGILFYTKSEKGKTPERMSHLQIYLYNSLVAGSDYSLAMTGYRHYGASNHANYPPWEFIQPVIVAVSTDFFGRFGSIFVDYDAAAFTVSTCCWQPTLYDVTLILNCSSTITAPVGIDNKRIVGTSGSKIFFSSSTNVSAPTKDLQFRCLLTRGAKYQVPPHITPSVNNNFQRADFTDDLNLANSDSSKTYLFAAQPTVPQYIIDGEAGGSSISSSLALEIPDPTVCAEVDLFAENMPPTNTPSISNMAGAQLSRTQAANPDSLTTRRDLTRTVYPEDEEKNQTRTVTERREEQQSQDDESEESGRESSFGENSNDSFKSRTLSLKKNLFSSELYQDISSSEEGVSSSSDVSSLSQPPRKENEQNSLSAEVEKFAAAPAAVTTATITGVNSIASGLVSSGSDPSSALDLQGLLAVGLSSCAPVALRGMSERSRDAMLPLRIDAAGDARSGVLGSIIITLGAITLQGVVAGVVYRLFPQKFSSLAIGSSSPTRSALGFVKFPGKAISLALGAIWQGTCLEVVHIVVLSLEGKRDDDDGNDVSGANEEAPTTANAISAAALTVALLLLPVFTVLVGRSRLSLERATFMSLRLISRDIDDDRDATGDKGDEEAEGEKDSSNGSVAGGCKGALGPQGFWHVPDQADQIYLSGFSSYKRRTFAPMVFLPLVRALLIAVIVEVSNLGEGWSCDVVIGVLSTIMILFWLPLVIARPGVHPVQLMTSTVMTFLTVAILILSKVVLVVESKEEGSNASSLTPTTATAISSSVEPEDNRNDGEIVALLALVSSVVGLAGVIAQVASSLYARKLKQRWKKRHVVQKQRQYDDDEDDEATASMEMTAVASSKDSTTVADGLLSTPLLVDADRRSGNIGSSRKVLNPLRH